MLLDQRHLAINKRQLEVEHTLTFQNLITSSDVAKGMTDDAW